MIEASRVSRWALAWVAAGMCTAQAMELPKATQGILKELNISEGMLSGIDQELTLPEGWEEKARQEGKLTVVSTWDQRQFRKMTAPFLERYPYIQVKYSRESYNNRVVKTLIAWKEGRHIADIVTGFGGGYFLFRDAGALEDLRDIPGTKNVIPKGFDPGGMWVGQRLRYWCMSYNTGRVKKADLPKTWNDIVTNTKWHDKKIGLGNRPQLWLLMLWGEKGPEWTTNYMKAFVERVQPQLRKEGTNALVALTIAGEFEAAIPSAAYRVKQYTEKGAPIAWHCPEPVPMAVSEMGIVKGSPNTHAAKIFANWFLSKEGQISQFAADNAPPVHKDMQTKEFLAFPEQIIGREIAFRGPELEDETKKMYAVWEPLWEKFAAQTKQKMLKISTMLDAVKSRGRNLEFRHEGKVMKVMVSGRRTALTIDGKKESRSNLKPGMACEIVMPEGGIEAASVACKQ